MRLIIAGSRTIGPPVGELPHVGELRILASALKAFADEHSGRGVSTVSFIRGVASVVCGMARGADELGHWWGIKNDIPVVEYYPDWEAHGKSAGFIRNEEMARNADALLLIWDGKSRGSADMLKRAKKHRLLITEFVAEPTR